MSVTTQSLTVTVGMDVDLIGKQYSALCLKFIYKTEIKKVLQQTSMHKAEISGFSDGKATVTTKWVWYITSMRQIRVGIIQHRAYVKVTSYTKIISQQF